MKRRKQKKYVEKYRDLAAIERAMIDDNAGLFAKPPTPNVNK